MIKILKFFIDRPRITFLLIIASVIFGSVSLASLPRESDPEVEIPFAVVTTIYPGASPSSIETLITKKIEDKVDQLDDIKEINSSSIFGVSSISVEFEAEADLDKSIRELKDKVDEAKNDLPSEAEDPIVTEASIDDQPIVTFSFGSKTLQEEELFDIVENVQTNLEKLSGISEVDEIGIRKKEIQVLLDRQKIESLNLSANLIFSKIKNAHTDFPIGEISLAKENFSMRLAGKFKGAEDLKMLPILTTKNKETIFLQDIAKVYEDREKISSYSFLKIGQPELLSTASLQIKKETGGNIVQIVQAAKDKIKQMQEEGEIPSNVKVQLTNNMAEYVQKDIENLWSNAKQTILIVILIIWIALGFKEAFLAGISIPLVFLLTFFTMHTLEDTLNGLSMFSLVLCLGLVVDTTIVITEGIFDGIHEKKLNSHDAAVYSIKTFYAPVISGALTTVSAFVPMLLMSGIMGQYMSVIPKTITPALLWSLVVALVFIPAIAVILFKNGHAQKKEKPDYKPSKILQFFKNSIFTVLNRVLSSWWQKILIITLCCGFLFLSGQMVKDGKVKIVMLPPMDANFFYINLEMPEGVNLETTFTETKKITALLDQKEHKKYIKNFLLKVGKGTISPNKGSGGSKGSLSHTAAFTINLLDEKERDKTSNQIAKNLRQDLKEIITFGKISIEEVSGGPPTGKPVQVRIYGDDFDEMALFAKKVKKELEQVPSAIEISDDVSVSSGEFVFDLKRDRLEFYGLSAQDIAMELRTIIFGSDVAEIARGDDDIDIRLAFDWKNKDRQPQSIEEIKNLKINLPQVKQNKQIPITEVVDINLKQGFSTINHRNLKGAVIVSSSVDTESNSSAMEILQKIEQKVNKLGIPKGIEVEYGGENEDTTQSMMDLFNALIIALVLIVFILVLQFRSYIQPLIIVGTVPFSLVSVVFGFWTFSWPISLVTFIGIVSLFGIIVNDSIVLIDQINVNRLKGMKRKEAVIKGAQDRLKPIFLTSATTICGILPLAISDEMWGGLGYAIIFGLTTSTVLAILVIPIFYTILDDLPRFIKFICKFIHSKIYVICSRKYKA